MSIAVSLFSFFLDVLSGVSFDWPKIVKNVGVYGKPRNGSSDNVEQKNGTEIRWSLTPKFPACQTVELDDYFPNRIHKQSFIRFNKVENIAVDVHLEDRNFVLDRNIKSSLFGYSGPKINIENLYKVLDVNMAFNLFEHMDSSLDKTKNCTNYPTEKFKSYKECDKQFVYYKMKQKGSLQYIYIYFGLKLT